MTHVHQTYRAVIALAVLAACADGVGPVDVAGTYDLQTVNGAPVPLAGAPAPVSGSLTLTAVGAAERRVTYRMDAQGTLRAVATTGTFRLRGSILELTLREDGSVWKPTAAIAGATVTLRYPHPADGPDIVEVYQRR
jgi:hypothetical protein